MKDVITGTDQETGQPIELTVEAADVITAAATGTRKGVAVSAVRPVVPAAPPSMPRMETPPPIMPMVSVPSPPVKKAGVRRVSTDRPVLTAFKIAALVLIGASLIGIFFAVRGVVLDSVADAEASAKVDRLVQDAKTALDTGDVPKAETLLDEALDVAVSPNHGVAQTFRAKSLRTKIRNSDDGAWVLATLTEATDEEFARFRDGGTPPIALDFGHAVLTDRAIALARPQIEAATGKRAEAKRQAEIAAEEHRQQQLAAAEAATATAAEEARARSKAARRELIENQFSGWDGSHRSVVKKIKDGMNDPDSYQHVETRYVDMGDYLRVTTSFRGKNKFGGVVKNTVFAKVDLHANVFEINFGE